MKKFLAWYHKFIGHSVRTTYRVTPKSELDFKSTVEFYCRTCDKKL